jgi:hydrogenase maturation protease
MTKKINPILVLGLGNPLQSDDGVGCHVIKALESHALAGDIDLIDGGTLGVGLVNLFEGRRWIIVVDAAEMGESPGTIKRLEPKDVREANSGTPYSLHHLGVAEALQLASALNLPLPKITLFGIQPMRIGWGDTLSAPVQVAIPHVVSAILQILGIGRSEVVPTRENEE